MADAKVHPVLVERFAPEHPPAVNVEISTDCNYACKFCPQSSYRRPPQYMTRESFELLLRRLAEIDFRNMLVLSVNNEPFLHPLILDFFDMAAVAVPKAKVVAISNGSLLTKEHLCRLSKIVPQPSLTIDDYTPDHHVARRISLWLGELGGRSLPVKIVERSMDEELSNRAGNQPMRNPRVEDLQDIVCTWMFMGMFVNPELQAFLCCSDYRYEMICGDLRNESLMSVWTGPVYQSVRKRMLSSRRRQIHLCSRCDSEWFHLPEHCLSRSRSSP